MYNCSFIPGFLFKNKTDVTVEKSITPLSPSFSGRLFPPSPDKQSPVAYKYKVPVTIRIQLETALKELLKKSINSSQLEFLRVSDRPVEEINVSKFNQDLADIFQFMNTPYSERAEKFGDTLLGLHYDSDFLKELHKQGISTSFEGYLNTNKMRLVHPDCFNRENGLQLSYYGNNPAEALDKLLAGPTVIDCGMSIQIAILVALKKQLGSEQFNLIFGKKPFRITQYLWNGNDVNPENNNPLYEFFSYLTGSVCIKYFQNDQAYRAKHGGGNDTGHNTIHLPSLSSPYLTFDPNGAPSTEERIKADLVKAFNTDPTESAKKCHAKWEANPKNAPYFAKDYISQLKALASKQISADDVQLTRLLYLDFSRINELVAQNQVVQKKLMSSAQPLDPTIKKKDIDIPGLPAENKNMTFAKYEKGITQKSQRKALEIAQHFVNDVLSDNQPFLTLYGPAGIGKTACITATAKYLASQGKKVLFLSEVLVKKLTASFSFQELESIDDKLSQMISEYDVVIMDDNNLDGYLGKHLDIVIQKKFFEERNISVLKTSNIEPNHHKEVSSQSPYTDPLWLNVWHVPLDGTSLRKKAEPIQGETDLAKITELQKATGRNAGIIVQDCEVLSSTGIEVGYTKNPQRYIPIDRNILEKKTLKLECSSTDILFFKALDELVEKSHDHEEMKLTIINKTGLSNEELVKRIKENANSQNKKRFLSRFETIFGF